MGLSTAALYSRIFFILSGLNSEILLHKIAFNSSAYIDIKKILLMEKAKVGVVSDYMICYILMFYYIPIKNTSFVGFLAI